MENPIEFKGKKAERELAQEIFELMSRQGAIFSLDAPIRQSLENLVEYFHQKKLRQDRDQVVELVEAALEKNAHIFAREVDQEQVFYVTTRRGRPAEAIPLPSLPPRQLHKPPEGASPKPQRKTSRRPPMAPLWVRTAIQQRQPPRPRPATRPISLPAVEGVAVAAVARVKKPATVLPLPDGTRIDFAQDPTQIFARHGDLIARHLRESLARDFRLLSFGDQWYPEDALEHLSKGRLNEIRRYIMEEEVALTDETILGDLFFKNPRDSDYALWAFSLNARLLREKKEFEYVGVPGHNLWSVKGLPAIGSPEIKAADVGQDYAFLLEEDEAVEPPDQLEHFLTFYEYRYGVLPYNALFRAFFPPPVLEEQRSAQLRFEVPQHYEAYTVELRYPSGNRGGWLWGLEEFFHSSLVPGAFIIISPTEDPATFILQYMATEGQEKRLLVYEPRKRRYIFDEILFYCEVEESMVLSQERFPSLHNSKPLPPSMRRRPGDVVAHTFTLIGKKEKGRYRASIRDLFPVVNIERPFSMALLTQTLEELDPFAPAQEEGVYLYTPEEE